MDISFTEGSFCDAAQKAFGGLAKLLSCEFKCVADNENSTVYLKCNSIKYY